MFLRLLVRSLTVRVRRLIPAVVVVALGAALATFLLSLLLDIDRQVGRELRNYGANLVLIPRDDGALAVEAAGTSLGSLGIGATIPEDDLYKIKKIFWKNNITGFAPLLKGVVEARAGQRSARLTLVGTWFDHELAVPGEPGPFKTGIVQISPWWRVEGAWPSGGDGAGGSARQALVGAGAARRLGVVPGEAIRVPSPGGGNLELTVAGILSTGGFEEDQVLVPLPVAQRLYGLHGRVSEVRLSALVVPPGRLDGKDPETMTPQEKEILFCSPTVASIGEQIRGLLPSVRAKAIGQVARAEGLFLGRMELAILLITVLTLAASGLGLAAAMTVMALERRQEIGILKAIGADNWQIGLICLTEAFLIGIAGGLTGYLAGLGASRAVGLAVFGEPITQSGSVFPATLALSAGLALLGSLIPVRGVVAVDPIEALRGG